ncbi:MAG TPA: GH1 family beta-glucosidase [Candidatus Baltobacteraceae bacterium]|nr:GH1 family beta-glucosidase [Candidatus Baltobacteraceae bacterium]
MNHEFLKALDPRFVWGAATSAYQIEGAISEDGRGESIWDRFCRLPGRIAGDASGAVACDHYHRFREDVALMRSLDLDAYRFSISWPRVIPSGTGTVNQKGLDFYRRLVETLHEAGIRPFATLYHWDLPEALQDRWGGWLGRDTAKAFAEYADIVSSALGDGVSAWITLNEPWVSSWLGYGWGSHPPGYRSLDAGMQAAHHLLLAHGLAVPALRENAPASEVGIALNFSPIVAASGDSLDVEAARAADINVNASFLGPLFGVGYDDLVLAPVGYELLRHRDDDMRIIRAPIDFLGVNYYTRFVLRHGSQGPNPFGEYVDLPGAQRTAMGWGVHPDGLYDTLKRVNAMHPGGKIYVTENGAAFPDVVESAAVHDTKRVDYLAEHLAEVSRAVDEGMDIGGYFVWSLLDNFEWTEGYRPRFGIVYVDFETQERIVKDSGHWYRALIEEHRMLSGPVDPVTPSKKA